MLIEKITNRIKNQADSISILIFSLTIISTFFIFKNIYFK